MGLLLYILLFIFVYCVAKVAWKFYTLYRRLHDVTRQFRDFSAGQTAERPHASTTTPTGEVVEDRRTEDEINRKIFTQEEGEYIDFEEEK